MARHRRYVALIPLTLSAALSAPLLVLTPTASAGSMSSTVAAPTSVSAAKGLNACPAKVVKRVWYGGPNGDRRCENIEDLFDHLFYPGNQFSTRLADTYRFYSAVIQLRLKDLGYKPGPIDGKYGSVTAKAVRAYQREHDLVADGKVGKVTWKALFGLGPA